MEYEYKKYETTIDGLRETLTKYGVAIIPNVLTPEECKQMEDGMWNSLETITKKFEVPINRKKPKTWDSFYDLMPTHSMLLQHWKIGHAQFVWDLRQNQKVLDIQENFWGVDAKDLLVSFDAASFHIPPEVTNRGWLQTTPFNKGQIRGWLHTDQSYTRNNFECVQTWVTALDVNEGDATLTFLEGSHAYHGEFAEKFGVEDKSDWYKLSTQEEHDFYKVEKNCKQMAIKCPAGSQVFWDSRLIHSGQEPVKGRTKPNFRCIVYLCYTPKYLASKKMIEKKQKYFNEMRMTNHWPHKITVFGESPRTYGQDLPPITYLPRPNVSNIGKSLAGFEYIEDNKN
jgi:hypothetical protein